MIVFKTFVIFLERRTIEREGEPYWFKFDLLGHEIKVDQCIAFRFVTGTIILIMTVLVFMISFGVIGGGGTDSKSK